MQHRITSPLPQSEFWRQYSGRASGILHWPDMDAFWQQLQQTNGDFYVFDPDEDAPGKPLSGAALQASFAEAKALVYSRRNQPISGAVYVDNHDDPGFIKVFDPGNMGSSCNCSTGAAMPRFIFSRAKPESLPLAPPPKTGLLARLTGRN